MDNKLIERITKCMEEFGMPEFGDRTPAICVLQIIKDSGYFDENNSPLMKG